MLALAGGTGATKGVDSTQSTDAVLEAAAALARLRSCIVSMSGATDVIVDGQRVTRVDNGHPVMARVTGMGCTATAITGAMAAAAHAEGVSMFDAAVEAMVLMGVCGEQAAAASAGPGTFVPQFIDALAGVDDALLAARGRVREGASA